MVVYGVPVTNASASPGSGDRLDDPFARLTGSLAGASHWQLEVVATTEVSPHLRRVEFTAPGLGALDYRPGQDLMLLVAVDGNRPVRRRYTIRGLDRDRDLLTADIVLHGDGPGARWARAARPGVTVAGIAPRGKVFPAQDADWHLFVGDESALPATAVMAESLPASTPVLVVLEVPEPADQQPISTAASLTTVWLARNGRPAGEPEALVNAVATLPLPTGRGHAYLAGEARVVAALRDVLAGRGLAGEQVSPKAYWGRGRANASHGEPAKD